MSEDLRANPYVGLRPFFVDDSLYFYGRDQQTAELLAILREHRFLSVVGSSGSGKSSLVRAGLLPGLLSGFLVRDRDRWRTVQIKPGDAPLANLAEGLCGTGASAGAAAALEHAIREQHTEAIVSHLGAQLDGRTNVFILVDQFEEIFAFRDGDDSEAGTPDLANRKERARRHAEAADFVDLLMRLSEQRELPIYVALTMRTDFLGECDLFYGLPEALNRGRYLVPRLTREQLRDSVECPAMLLGAEMAPRLLDHILNELGDRADRLPMLQHALQRTWDAWHAAGRVGPIDLAHYQAAGGIEGALNQDAEGALAGLDRGVAAGIFKRLTDTDESQRRVRSPARISELMAATADDRATVEAIVKRFEEGGRNFVYRSADGNPDDPRVDISHESLIRQWNSLRTWVDEERASRDAFRDLLITARKRADSKAGLLQDPELRIVFDWREKERPSAGWARRYSLDDSDFAFANAYLDDSIDARSHQVAEKELRGHWRWRGRPVAVLVALALTWAIPQRMLSAVAGRDSTPTSLAVVDGLVWTTDDRHKTTTWQEAERHCEALEVAGSDDGRVRTSWRLPEAYELRTLSSSATPDGLGRKLLPAFHNGVTASYLWSKTSPTGSASDRERFAADFIRGVILPLSVDVPDAAAALCVTAEEAAAFDEPEEQWAFALARYSSKIPVPVRVAILFLTLYYGVAEGGKALHRRWLFGALVRRFAAAGGRLAPRPQVKEVDRPDAITALNTQYATTFRRGVASIIDLTLVLMLVGLIVSGLLLFIPSRTLEGTDFTLIRKPDGTTVQAVGVSSYPDRLVIQDGEGKEQTFPVIRSELEYFGQTGGEPIEAMLPSGQMVKGETFLRQEVIAVESDTREEWYGTSDAAPNSDGAISLTYSREHWTRTRDAAATHLRWIKRSSPPSSGMEDQEFDAQIRSAMAQWEADHPPPPDGGYGTRTVHLRVAELVDHDSPALFRLLALTALVAWLYEAHLTASRQKAMIGMAMMGIIRTDLHGGQLSFWRVTARFWFRLFSFLTTCLGFVVQPFTKRRQTLHDQMAGTVVLREPRPDGPPPAPPSRWYTAAMRMVVLGVYLAILLALFAVVSTGGTTGLASENDDLEASWVSTWGGLGVELAISELMLNGQVVDTSPADADPRAIPIARDQQVQLRLASVLRSRGVSACGDTGCPINYQVGYDYFAGDPASPDAGELEERAVFSQSACDAPPLRARSQGEQMLFRLDAATPALVKPGRYELWIDFTKTCGEAPDTSTAWNHARLLATLEVK